MKQSNIGQEAESRSVVESWLYCCTPPNASHHWPASVLLILSLFLLFVMSARFMCTCWLGCWQLRFSEEMEKTFCPRAWTSNWKNPFVAVPGVDTRGLLSMISEGIEPSTFSVLTKCDNRYTMKPCETHGRPWVEAVPEEPLYVPHDVLNDVPPPHLMTVHHTEFFEKVEISCSHHRSAGAPCRLRLLTRRSIDPAVQRKYLMLHSSYSHIRKVLEFAWITSTTSYWSPPYNSPVEHQVIYVMWK